MSVGFFLKDKKKATTYINTIVAFKGKYFKRSTGESVPVRSWSDSAQRCKEAGFKDARRINKELNKIFVAATEACDYFVEKRIIPQNVDFWERVDFILSGGKIVPSLGFVDYLRNHIDSNRGRLADRTIIKYNTLLNKLTEYESVKKRKLSFEDIDIGFYRDFERWIYSYKREDNTVGYAANYFGALIQCIKVVFREARENGLHNLTGIDHKDFKTVRLFNEINLLTFHYLNEISTASFSDYHSIPTNSTPTIVYWGPNQQLRKGYMPPKIHPHNGCGSLATKKNSKYELQTPFHRLWHTHCLAYNKTSHLFKYYEQTILFSDRSRTSVVGM